MIDSAKLRNHASAPREANEIKRVSGCGGVSRFGDVNQVKISTSVAKRRTLAAVSESGKLRGCKCGINVSHKGRV
jgi:hypothetical protein